MNTIPTTYAIRVEGHLDDHWSAWPGELDLTREDDGATTVTVEVADQAQLHGVLAGLRDIGAVISELRARDAPAQIVRSVLERPLHTERLTLRPATPGDAEATWRFRRLESVNEWMTGSPAGVRELLRHCFQDLGVRRVTASCFLANDASWRLMERVGMRRELHAVRESLHRSGRWLDTVGYAILGAEWQLPEHADVLRERARSTDSSWTA